MKSICLYFQVHQPFRLRTYRFFEMGEDHYYYDDYQNRFIVQQIANECYIPMNQLLLELIQEYGKDFKVSFSISGTALEQFEKYAPEVLSGFRRLIKTGNVEMVAETYYHSLASLKNTTEFKRQIELNIKKLKDVFKVERPTTFCNAELIYSDNIGEDIADMGFKTILTEGPKHVLGWKSANYVYGSALNANLNVLLRNFPLSDDITLRFPDCSWNQWPLTAEKFSQWVKGIDQEQPILNLFFRYETFGSHIKQNTGIFEFLRALPEHILKETDYKFMTPCEISEKYKPVSRVYVPYPISWADEERDISSWMGNEMQAEALQKLYEVSDLMINCKDEKIRQDWERLQTTEHAFFMCTKWFTAGDIRKEINPYENPYNAFINYMNVLSDLLIRLKEAEQKNNPKEAKEEIDIMDVISERVQTFADELEDTAKEWSKKIEKKAKKVVKQGKKSLQSFDFDQLLEQSDKKIKQLINEVDAETWAKALNQASDELTDKVLNNMVPKIRKEYDETVKNLKKITKTEINKSKKKIEDIWNKL
ncbi:MAG: FliG C-terminal domain-containing protein [Bacteroidales bacterium]|nr:FliG C-terminal domain-containing protein [Bacteroidales bacterium]